MFCRLNVPNCKVNGLKLTLFGEKEEKSNTVAVRTLDGKVKFNVKVKDLINRILDNIEKKKEKFEI